MGEGQRPACNNGDCDGTPHRAVGIDEFVKSSPVPFHQFTKSCTVPASLRAPKCLYSGVLLHMARWMQRFSLRT